MVAAHIHKAAAGKIGPIVFGFFQSDDFLLDFHLLRDEWVFDFFEFIGLQTAVSESVVDALKFGFESRESHFQPINFRLFRFG